MSNTTYEPLTGDALLERIKQLGDVSKEEVFRACGYTEARVFYEELLKAKGLTESPILFGDVT